MQCNRFHCYSIKASIGGKKQDLFSLFELQLPLIALKCTEYKEKNCHKFAGKKGMAAKTDVVFKAMLELKSVAKVVLALDSTDGSYHLMSTSCHYCGVIL